MRRGASKFQLDTDLDHFSSPFWSCLPLLPSENEKENEKKRRPSRGWPASGQSPRRGDRRPTGRCADSWKGRGRRPPASSRNRAPRRCTDCRPERRRNRTRFVLCSVYFVCLFVFGRETWKRIETGGSYLELRRFDVGSFGRGANVSETVTVFGVDT